MQNYNEKQPVVSGLNEKDQELRKLAAVDRQNSVNETFAKAFQLFGERKWEDVYRPLYSAAIPMAIGGGVISFLIGIYGCLDLGNAISTGIVGTLVGVTIGVGIEIGKFYAIKYTFDSYFAGYKSVYAFAAAAFLLLALSVTTSFQSMVYSENFKAFVSRFAPSVAPADTRVIEEIDRNIAQHEATLNAVAKARSIQKKAEPSKNPSWVMANEENTANAAIAELKARKEFAIGEGKKAAELIAQEKAFAKIKSWLFAILILPETFTLIGIAFSRFYLYRLWRLQLLRGNTVKRETTAVEEATVHVARTQATPKANADNTEKLLAQLRQEMLEMISQRDQKEESKAQQPHPPTPPTPKTPIVAPPSPPVHPPQNGQTQDTESKDAVKNDQRAAIGFALPLSQLRKNNDDSGVITPNYSDVSDETLLSAFRKRRQEIATYKSRLNIPAQKETAEANIDRLEAIIAELEIEAQKRGKVFLKQKSKGIVLVDSSSNETNI